MVDINSVVGVAGSIGEVSRALPMRLGDLILDSWACPSELTNESEQSLVVHDTVGGTRVVESGGPRLGTWRLTGYFNGPTALVYAKLLEQMTASGEVVTFTSMYGSEQVKIKSSRTTLKWAGQWIPFDIVLQRGTSKYIGPSYTTTIGGIAGTITSIGNVLSEGTQIASHALAGLQSTIGQLYPLIDVLGLGKPFDKAQGDIGALQSATGIGQIVANDAGTLASTSNTLVRIGGNLTSGVNKIGQNIARSTSITNSNELTNLVADCQSESDGALAGYQTDNAYLKVAVAQDMQTVPKLPFVGSKIGEG